MKTTVILLVAASSVFADVFKQRIKVGRLTCTCSFNLIAAGSKLSPKSKVSCDKKCSGVAKRVLLEGDSGVFTFDMKVAKGKVSLSKGSVKVATTTEMTTQTTEATGTTEDGITPVGTENNTGGTEPGPTGTGSGSGPNPTGTGSGPEPTGTGTGSGSEPESGTGSGSGEEPVPIGTGSGTGPGTGSGTVFGGIWGLPGSMMEQEKRSSMTTKEDMRKMQVLQNSVMRIMSRGRYDTPTSTLLESTNQLSIHQLVAYHSANQIYNIQRNQFPKYHYNRLFGAMGQGGDMETRSRMNIESRVDFRTSLARGSFFYQGSRVWNALPATIKTSRNIESFKKQTRAWTKTNISIRP